MNSTIRRQNFDVVALLWCNMHLSTVLWYQLRVTFVSGSIFLSRKARLTRNLSLFSPVLLSYATCHGFMPSLQRSSPTSPGFVLACIQKFPDWVLTKYTLTTINTQEATQRAMAAKLTRLTHKMTIQLHLAAESCTICSCRSRHPVRKLLDTPSYPVLCYAKLSNFPVRYFCTNLNFSPSKSFLLVHDLTVCNLQFYLNISFWMPIISFHLFFNPPGFC
jgi:hypothetical protein